MDERRLTGISRVLSHALRHDPGYYGLTLDPEGWVDLKDMVGALRRTLATTGYADVKELQRVEVVLSPYAGSAGS